jgi:hypothetical protein
VKYAVAGVVLFAAGFAAGSLRKQVSPERKTVRVTETVTEIVPEAHVVRVDAPSVYEPLWRRDDPDATLRALSRLDELRPEMAGDFLRILEEESDDDQRRTAITLALLCGGPAVTEHVLRRDLEFLEVLGEPGLPIPRGRIRVDEAFATSLLHSRNPSERRAGIALSTSRDRILDLALRDPDEDVREAAFRVLACIGDRETLARLEAVAPGHPAVAKLRRRLHAR